ncbi:hypothetical protein M5K25_017136 [Dendrobium thyrsiflorum]|uniref:Uncharacterized protein n=1 Tax=Dendrobium thyrsiflorum TaxID=117978 RepID=A0ABD0UTD5_DENTH
MSWTKKIIIIKKKDYDDEDDGDVFVVDDDEDNEGEGTKRNQQKLHAFLHGSFAAKGSFTRQLSSSCFPNTIQFSLNYAKVHIKCILLITNLENSRFEINKYSKIVKYESSNITL